MPTAQDRAEALRIIEAERESEQQSTVTRIAAQIEGERVQAELNRRRVKERDQARRAYEKASRDLTAGCEALAADVLALVEERVPGVIEAHNHARKTRNTLEKLIDPPTPGEPPFPAPWWGNEQPVPARLVSELAYAMALGAERPARNEIGSFGWDLVRARRAEKRDGGATGSAIEKPA